MLGMLIPPSLLLILSSVLTETSSGDLFTAGILSSLLLSTAYIIYILAVVYLFLNYVLESAVKSTDENSEEMDLLAAG